MEEYFRKSVIRHTENLSKVLASSLPHNGVIVWLASSSTDLVFADMVSLADL